MNIVSLLQFAYKQLTATSASPRLDAELLLAHVLQVKRSYLYTWPEHTPETLLQEEYKKIIKQRSREVPIAYLVGEKEFWSLLLKVNEHTLIPRPETELLVTLALEKLATEKKQAAQIADLGTGSGAIALAIAKELPTAVVYATEQNPETLEVAKFNQQHLNIPNIRFFLGNWCRPLPIKNLNLIVSNPPYIAAQDPHLQEGDLRYEPMSALVSGLDGLAAIRIICKQAQDYLTPMGLLMLEHGYNQGEQVRNLFSLEGYTEIQTYRDLNGRERVTIGRAIGII